MAYSHHGSVSVKLRHYPHHLVHRIQGWVGLACSAFVARLVFKQPWTGRSTRFAARPRSPRRGQKGASRAPATTSTTASSISPSAEQLEGTLTKHFAGEANLVLLAVNTERLGERLQWEPSRGGEVFPHLYGPLDLGVVLWVEPLTLGADGRYRLPARVLP